MSRLAPGKAEKLISRFEAAVIAYEWGIRMTPLPPYEDKAAWGERIRIKGAVTKTRNRLLKALENNP